MHGARAGLLLLLAACAQPGHDPAGAERYAALRAELTLTIEHELAHHGLPGFALALYDHGEIVWTQGFGHADPRARTPARADAIWRMGSISKWMTATAVLQLVAEGRLDLDAPVGTWLPEFKARAAAAPQPTLRQLLAHRGGLVREPPRGHYFCADDADLATTVASVAALPAVYPPGERFKYSNAGAAVAGRVLEVGDGRPFAASIQQRVFDRLGMRDACFGLTPGPRRAQGMMWAYDRPPFPAPNFALGMAPAANLECSLLDLMAFARGICTRTIGDPRMFEIQFARAGQQAGAGLGCFVDRFAGERRVGHGGAMYGFASELMILPDCDLAVAAVTNLDFANAVVARIAEHALACLLAVRRGEALPAYALSTRLSQAVAQGLPGVYRRDGHTQRIELRDGRLWLEPPWGEAVTLAGREGEVITDGVFGFGKAPPLGQRLEGSAARPAPCPAALQPLLGEYGWPHDVLYLREQDGGLQLLIEWFEFSTLKPVAAPDRWQVPDHGLYAGETLQVLRGADGAITGVQLGGVTFPRRALGPADGGTFRITPARDIAAVRAEAAAARPPAQPAGLRASDLVELTALDATLRLDLRYATTDNFLGVALYERPRALLQRPAAQALLRAHRRLAASGYGLWIHDAYRPWSVTKMFWEATPAALRNFVADPATGSRHNRGCAVDLTLYELATGKPVEMVSGFDEFTPRAFPHYPGGTALQRWHRTLLREAMEREGFTVYAEEWWHFDHADWRAYPVLNEPL